MDFISKWKSDHSGLSPSSPADWRELSRLIADGERTNNPDGGEDNFKEAAKACLQLVLYSSQHTLPDEVSTLFDQCPAEEAITTDTPCFWIVICAIRHFYHTHGVLPVPGPIPDMIATTSTYVQLQTIYRQKAITDAAEVASTVRKIEGVLQATGPLRPDGVIPDQTISLCCRNMAEMRFVKGWRHYPVDRQQPSGFVPSSVIEQMGFNDPDSALPIRIAFLAFESTISNPELYVPPTDSAADPTTLPSRLRQATRARIDNIIRDLTTSAQQQAVSFPSLECDSTLPSVDEQFVASIHETSDELMRPVISSLESFYSLSSDDPSVDHSRQQFAITSSTAEAMSIPLPELHNTAAVVGGIVTQETIKILTGQFTTRNYSIAWDGVRCRVLVDDVL